MGIYLIYLDEKLSWWRIQDLLSIYFSDRGSWQLLLFPVFIYLFFIYISLFLMTNTIHEVREYFVVLIFNKYLVWNFDYNKKHFFWASSSVARKIITSNLIILAFLINFIIISLLFLSSPLLLLLLLPPLLFFYYYYYYYY